MKKIKPFVIILSVMLLLTGCANFRISATIEDLISPVSPSGDNAGIQSAVDEYCKTGYSIKIPASGNYTTSFILHDLDGDGMNEAVAFYEMSDKTGTVCMAVLKKNNDKWSVIEKIDGAATDVNSVDFCDLNNDSSEEIIVCWSIVSKTTGSSLNVYKQTVTQSGEYKLKKISDSVTASNFVCVDMNDDGANELLIFTNGASSDYPKAELYSYKNDKKAFLGSTKLDNGITLFERITCAKTDEGMSVFADAVKSNGSSMVTELIYWSDYYDSIISPFYSYSTGKTSATSRNNEITSRDIDNDGFVEIPTDASIKKLPAEISAQNWMVYDNTVLNHKCYSISCKRDGIIITIPDKYFKNIKVNYNSKQRKIEVVSKKTDEAVFDIITVIKTTYDSRDEKYAGYEEIFSSYGYVYLARVNTSSDIDTDIKTLKNMIKAY